MRLALVGLAACSAGAHRGAVTVRVTGDTPQGVAVYFQDSDGRVIDHTTTDDSGMASGTVTDGGGVTALDPFGTDPQGGTEIYTLLGVQPGDALVLAPPPSTQFPFGRDTLTVTFPTASDPAIARYQVFPAECDGAMGDVSISAGSATTTLTLCGPMADLLVVAYDASSNPVAWAYAGDVVVSAAPVTLPLTFAPFSSVSLTFTNIPPMLGNATDVQGLIRSPRGWLWAVGQSFGVDASLHIDGHGIDFPGAVLQTAAFLQRDIEGDVVVDEGANAATVTMDVGSRLLREETACPVYALDSRTLSWPESGPGVAAEFAVATLSVVPHHATTGWTWNVMTPVDGTAVTLPTFSGDLADFALHSLDYYRVTSLARGTAAGGYDAVRASGVWPVTPNDASLGKLGAAATSLVTTCN